MNIRARIFGTEDLQAKLKEMQEKVPFSLSRGLNKTAYDAQQHIRAQIPSWVKLTGDFLPRSVVYNKSAVVSKNEANIMTSQVGFLDRVPLLPLFEFGGLRVAVTSKNIAIPVDIRRTSRGRIPYSRRPRQVMDKKNTFIDKIDGNLGIWQSTKSGKGLKLLYLFKRTTRYLTKQFRFFETATDFGNKHLILNIENEIIKSVIPKSRKKR